MTQLAADLFERADGGLGSDWTAAGGELTIASGNVRALSDATASTAYNNTVTWPADVYVEVICGTIETTSDEGIGPAIIVDAQGDGYFVQTNTTETRCYSRTIGGTTFAQVGADAAACSVGDTLRLERSGTTITVKKNGSTIIGPTTNSVHSGGSAGLWAFNNVGKVQSWAAGNFEAPAGSTTLMGQAVM